MRPAQSPYKGRTLLTLTRYNRRALAPFSAPRSVDNSLSGAYLSCCTLSARHDCIGDGENAGFLGRLWHVIDGELLRVTRHVRQSGTTYFRLSE
jgi:hypothetical protein